VELSVGPLAEGDWAAARSLLHRAFANEQFTTEPALHGCGIGRRLLDSAATVLAAEQPAELVLECAPDRVSFYAGLGYEAVSTIADPAGPDCSLMRRLIP
jgi:ribosomal protein S18 acetylase RimI-like enzyme